MRTTWASALTWRLERQHLGGTGAGSVVDVIDVLVAVPSWSGDAALATGLRLEPSVATGVEGELATALADGVLVRVFTFRGATHLMTPRQAADHLALRAAGRMWERASWVDFYRVTPQEWPELRAAVREALAAGPLPLAEMADAVATDPRWAHLRDPLSTPGTFVKPFFWQGDVCFGPSVDGSPTLATLDANPHWTGIPDLDEAGRRAVTSYLAAYGPATTARVHYWLGEGLGAGKRRIERWLADLAAADEVVTVDVDGDEALVEAARAESLVGTDPAPSVRLLPAQDQWVVGPGTADAVVVPPEHRQEVTRGANLLVVGGVVSGTWVARDGALTVTPWGTVHDLAAGTLADELAGHVARVGELRGQDLRLVVGG